MTSPSMPGWERCQRHHPVMQNGSALLGYKMFSDAGRTTNWGNSSSTGWVAGTGNGSAEVTPSMPRFRRGRTRVAAPTPIPPPLPYPAPASLPLTAQFSVTAIVVKDCTVSATNLAFGNYRAR